MQRLVGLLLILLTTFSLSSCNQNVLGAKTAIGNVLKLPIDGLKSAGNFITGNTYRNLKNNTPEPPSDKAIISPDNQCLQDINFTGNETLDSLSRNLAGVEASVCECITWGSCTKASCPCDTLCPRSLKIFKKTANQRIPNINNSLTFINNYYAFKETDYAMVKGHGGYCWGVAAATQRFNRVGIFRPDEPIKYDPRENPKEYVEYYKGVIDKVLNNEATEIPGYRNLNELINFRIPPFSDPALEEYLKNQVSRMWARKAMSPQGLQMVLSDQKMSSRRTNKVFDDIQEKIDNSLSPQIIFTEKNVKARSHVVLVYDYKKNTPEKGYTTYCLNDSNYFGDENEDCSKQIIRDSDDNLNYEGWGKIGGLRVAHNENSDTVEQANSLRRHCESERGCR